VGLVPTTAPIQKRRRPKNNDADTVPPVQKVNTKPRVDKVFKDKDEMDNESQ
jgi:hypothetical protein